MEADGSFTHMRLDVEASTIYVNAKLSEDALWAHIGSTGFSPPLLIHKRNLRSGEVSAWEGA
jgi:hypothetical protein